jgi:hypothetical protein
MMKKILPLLLAFFSFTFINAQYNQDAPWMKDLNVENKSTSVKFHDIVNAFNTYWETRDPNVKGSGYKPFKRWENYWENYVNEDGYLPTSADLWNTWLAKKSHIQIQRSPLGIEADESNWVSLGPTSFTNKPTSTANIGRINSVIVDPNNANTYYAGAPAGGIWKSTDAGLNWTPLSDELPQIGVSGIAIDYNNSNIIYIATGDDDQSDSISVGVFKSTDGGATWNQTGINPSNSPSLMNDIYIHPTDSNILWLATNNGVYKTINAGTSWSLTQSGNIRDIKVKPGDPSIIYAVTSSDFYKSTDGGDSFSLSNTGLPAASGRLVIDVTPANSAVVYVVSAATDDGYQGIYKSINSGASFTQQANAVDIFESTQSWYDLALAVSDTNEDEIYVGVLNIWKSIDGGGSFSQINQWFSHTASFTHADIHLLRFFNNELYAGTDGGFYKSSNGGSNFTDLTQGMEISQFYRISVSQQTSSKIAGGLQDNGGFSYVSSSWYNYHGGDGMEGVIDPNNDNLYFAFMQSGQNLFVSTTSGQSGGTQSFAGPEDGNWITPLAINNLSEVYAGYNSVYQFDGASWTAISPSFGTEVDALEIDPAEPDNMYVAINNSLRKSTDRAVSFSNVETFPTNITSIEVNNNDSSIIYVTTSGTSSGKVFKSIDGGLNFSDITGSLPNVTKNIIKHQEGDPQNALYLGTSIGVYRYDDNTVIWEVFENNLPNSPVRDLAISTTDNNITAATYGRGVWRTDLPATQLAQDDVRLVSIENPISLSLNCGSVTPQINVKNNGINDITSIDVTYNIDSGINNNFTWNGTLVSEATTTINIPEIISLRGLHELNVITTIVGDAFPNNNSSSNTYLTNDNGVTESVNTFENVEDELNTFNDFGSSVLWERGVPTGTLLNTAVSGSNVYGTNLNGNHPDATIAYLFSQCYNLSNIGSPILKFHMAFDLEFDWDLVYVQYTLDEGQNWSLLGGSAPNWYNSSRFSGDGLSDDCFNCVGGQWTGTNATMTEYSYDLNALSAETNVIFRIVFHSDQFVNQEGVTIDDLYVDGTTLGLDDFALNSVFISPNPSNNNFNIYLKNINKLNLNVYDVTGKLILKKINEVINHGKYTLDMANYASGIYFLNLESEGRRTTKKLILK